MSMKSKQIAHSAARIESHTDPSIGFTAPCGRFLAADLRSVTYEYRNYQKSTCGTTKQPARPGQQAAAQLRSERLPALLGPVEYLLAAAQRVEHVGAL
jgi:hypothetical protein